jgi:DnaJ-class molecular chaperone
MQKTVEEKVLYDEDDFDINDFLASEEIKNFKLPAPPKKKPCKRCGGTGKLKQYTHVKNGKCFECNGKGSIY